MAAPELPTPLPVLKPTQHERAMQLLARIYTNTNRVYGKGVHVPTTIPARDLDWMENVGLAPNRRRTLTHAELVNVVVKRGIAYSIREGAIAFVNSLPGDEAPHGAYLESVLLAHRMPAHRFKGYSSRVDAPCRICGLGRKEVVDTTEEFFDWHRLGTGIPGSLTWARRALAQLERAKFKRMNKAGKDLLLASLRRIDELPARAHPSAAFDAVAKATGLPVPFAQAVVETLAFAGLMDAPPYTGLAQGFVRYDRRDERPTDRTEVEAPLGFWRGKHGINWTSARSLFGVTRAQAQRAVASPRTQKAAANVSTKPPAKPKKAKAPRRLKRRPVRVGDVWAIRVREDFYVLTYAWEVEPSKRPYAKVEFLDWHGLEPPTALPAAMRVRHRYDGRWQYRAHGFEKATGSVLVAEQAPAPEFSDPEPDRTAAGSAKDLTFLADSCFPELDVV